MSKSAKISKYRPLLSLVVIACLAGLAIMYGSGGSPMHFMHYFMGIFLCIFAMLKLFHPDAFASGFAKYDIIGKRFRPYLYIYPYIELALGLGYLSFFMPAVVYSATIIVMIVGIIGVAGALKQGLNINCPCMGSVLDVPLSTVTLTENISMAAMAFLMLVL